MATIVVTGAGGACGLGAIRSLATETAHRVIGVDMKPTAAGIRFADDGRSVPPAADESWPAAMASVVDEFDADVIVPTVDEELAVLPSLSAALAGEVPIVAPRQDVIDLAMDKYRTAQRLSAAGHPVPKTWLGTEAESIDPAAFPIVVKPRQGRGSRGVERVADPEALAAHLSETPHEPEELLCQEWLTGTEYTTSVVGTAANRLLGVVPKEAIEKDGSTVLGATRRTPSVVETCQELFETLAPAGPLNVQQIVDDDGVPRVIEINPRFSSTSCLTVAAGVDEFDLLVRDALGERVSPPAEFKTDRYIVRYESHFFADGDEFETAPDIEADSEPLQLG